MNVEPDKKVILELVSVKMPFGKYEGRLICDLPEYYLAWFNKKGVPKGRLGMLLLTMYEIKINNLDYLLEPLRKK